MLKLKEPHSIFLKGGKEAVLILHSFTGTVRDVKDLATNLNQEGFTCYVPAYKGHGLSIEGFIEYNTNDWWKQVEESYQFLKAEGYDNISVLGVSLGGLMSLKLAETNEIKKCIVMSAPNNRTSEDIKRRLLSYGERINQIQGLNQAESERQLSLIDDYEFGATVFMELIEDIMSHLQLIKMPISIMYGEQDQLSYHDSAEYVYSKVGTSEKTLTSYEKAGHLMTRSEDKVKVEKDIVAFLKS